MIFLVPILALVAAAGYAANRFRNVEEDPGEWHVDPLTATSPATPNWYRLVPVDADVERDPNRDGHPPTYEVPAIALGAAFDSVARADERVEVLAGSTAEGHVTYVQRSKVFAFPDYVSVRFIDEPDERSTLAIFSRARFGQGDFGVNEKRVARWVDGVTKRLA